MSIRVTTYVWDHSEQCGSALLLMLAIADHAHDDGGGAYPSIARLAKKARTSERNVKLLLRKLENQGELEIERCAGPRGVNIYRVKKFHPQGPEGATQRQGGETQRQEGVKSVSPKPSLEPSTEPLESARASCHEVSVALVSLRNLRGYPHNTQEILKHLEKRYKKHKDHIDFKKEVENFCEYYEDKGFKKGERPFAKLTTWLNNASDWARPNGHAKNGQHDGDRERRDYDKHDAPDPETAASTARLMKEIGYA